MLRRSILWFFTVLIFILLAGCAGLSSPSGDGKEPGAAGMEPGLSAEHAEQAGKDPEADAAADAEARSAHTGSVQASDSSLIRVDGSPEHVSSAETGRKKALSPAVDARDPGDRRISPERIREAVRPYIPGRFVLVGDAEYRPLVVSHDLDGNGLEDIFLLLMELPTDADAATGGGNSDGGLGAGDADGGGEKPGEGGTSFLEPAVSAVSAEIEVRDGCVAETAISGMSRLFSEAYPFYLALFLRTPEGLVSMYRIPLGKWFVFEDFRGMLLDDDRSMPFAVRVSFQTHEGRERQLISFPRHNSFSFFTMKNSISITTEIRDIDEDGILDIVEWRKVFEEGTGYETFLTWFKWDGTKFAQYDSTNIVRNLNAFLETLGNTLSIGKWEQAVALALPGGQTEDLAKKLSLEEIILRLFPALPVDLAEGPDEATGGGDGGGVERKRTTGETGRTGAVASGGAGLGEEELLNLLQSSNRVFNMVFFPRFWENPFDTGDPRRHDGYRTRFSVRFILRDGRSLLRLCTVRMSENPFLEPQFFLEIDETDG